MKFILSAVMLMSVCYLISCTPTESTLKNITPEFKQALANGKLVNEGLVRCDRFVNDWLAESDEKSLLIPRNLDKDFFWNAKDAAADNYPFMVLTSSFTNKEMFEGRMRDMLTNEIKLSNRLDRLPDDYSFEKEGFRNEEVDTAQIIFGASEYIKDGLLPLTEWLGNSAWSDRMIGIMDDIWKYASIETEYGNIPSTNVEVNGEMLQALSRVYWMTSDQKYLDWAIRLGDYYLLGDQHPTRDFDKLRLRDHGCEIISGLCELYVAVNYADKEKKKEYEALVHEMLDYVLAHGRNTDGMFYNNINPQTGEQIGDGIADTWGYTYNGHYSVFMIDKTQAYKDAIEQVFKNLKNYENYNWEGGSSDGFADAIESGLNLYNRIPSPEAASWIDGEIKNMWSLQDSNRRETNRWDGSGIIEGWHGDGNFARTTIMYCLWKTQGTSIHPWNDGIENGAVFTDDILKVAVQTKTDWSGKVKFDKARHKANMNLPIDYPRINQFPEWFTVAAEKQYSVKNINSGESQAYSGQALLDGITIENKAGEVQFLEVTMIQ